MRIIAEHRDDNPYKKLLARNLVAYNDRNGPLEHWQYVGFYALDDKEELIGGVQGNFEWDWLHITHLWVKTPRNGLGGELIKKIEDYSKQNGKTGAFLDTFGFQAKVFYEKQGYHHHTHAETSTACGRCAPSWAREVPRFSAHAPYTTNPRCASRSEGLAMLL